MSTTTAGRRGSTRSRVLDAGRRLASRGEAFTLGEVAAEARVSRATVHRLFRSRESLLADLNIEPEPGSRERVIAAAVELLSHRTLENLGMEEVAGRAGVSRASLYRLFPGKSALFREVVREYSPLEPVGEVIRTMADQPPEVVMPAIAQAAAARLAGRVGLMRSLLSAIASTDEEADEARTLALTEVVGPVVGYLLSQMAAGRLRPMHPLLAIQTFVGPVAFHLLTRDVVHRLVGYDQPLAEAVDEIAAVWVRGMAPGPGGPT
jgi:AcrR family transcriptional regulator